MADWVPPEVLKSGSPGSPPVSETAPPAWIPPEVAKANQGAQEAPKERFGRTSPDIAYTQNGEFHMGPRVLESARYGLSALPMPGGITGQIIAAIKNGLRPSDSRAIEAVRQYLGGAKTEAAGPNAAETYAGQQPPKPQWQQPTMQEAPVGQAAGPNAASFYAGRQPAPQEPTPPQPPQPLVGGTTAAGPNAAETWGAAPARSEPTAAPAGAQPEPVSPPSPTPAARPRTPGMEMGGKWASSEVTGPPSAEAVTPKAALRSKGEAIAKPASQVLAQASKAERSVWESMITNRLFKAIYQQESGAGAANTSSPNAAGARGPMQITEDTFNQFAKKGEKWGNVEDNLRVGRRIIEYYVKKYDAHPGRAAAAYYSGEGNVASEGATPWVKNLGPRKGVPGPTVEEYVAQVMSRF